VRTIIISDIHGKAKALGRVFERHTGDPVICLGDALGSGDNSATLRLLREREVPCVKGNHEVDLLHLYELSSEDLAYVDSWPFTRSFGGSLFVHTWLEFPLIRYRQIDSILSAKEMFAPSSFNTAFVGHSHSPGWWTLEDERPVWAHEAVELVSRRETRSLLSLQNRSIVGNIADMPQNRSASQCQNALRLARSD